MEETPPPATGTHRSTSKTEETPPATGTHRSTRGQGFYYPSQKLHYEIRNWISWNILLLFACLLQPSYAFWSYSPSLPELFPDPLSFSIHPTLCSFLSFIFFKNPLRPIYATEIFLDVWSNLPLKHDWLNQVLHSWRKRSLSLPKLTISNRAMGRGETVCFLSMLGFCLAWACTGVHMLWELTCAAVLLCPEDCFHNYPLPLALAKTLSVFWFCPITNETHIFEDSPLTSTNEPKHNNICFSVLSSSERLFLALSI